MYIRSSLLRRHVLESNGIEGIHLRTGYLVQSHMAAALLVARHPRGERAVDPLRIHETLCRNTPMESFGGVYRRCGVVVGDSRTPRWEDVPRLMQWWRARVEELECIDLRSRAQAIELLHHWLLAIHPFEDGNGRTARLVLNWLRLECGLPWKVIEWKKRGVYYAAIRQTERKFKELFPDAYD